MCPLIRVSELSKVNPSLYISSYFFSPTQVCSSRNLLFLLKHQVFSLYRIVPISIQLYCNLSHCKTKQGPLSRSHITSSYGQISLLLVTAKLLERDASAPKVRSSSSHSPLKPPQPGCHPQPTVWKQLWSRLPANSMLVTTLCTASVVLSIVPLRPVPELHVCKTLSLSQRERKRFYPSLPTVDNGTPILYNTIL